MNLPAFLRSLEDGVGLTVKVQPRSSRNEIGEPLGAELKVWVAAPPVDDAANAALVDLLAEKLGCPRGAIELKRGHASRHKHLHVRGVTPEMILERLHHR